MKEEKKYRVLAFENHKGLALGIGEVLELGNYLALATWDSYAAMLALDSFCPDIVMLGYYRGGHKNYQQLLERCQYNYPILYLCIHDDVERIRNDYFYSSRDRIVEKLFDIEDMLRTLMTMHQYCGTC